MKNKLIIVLSVLLVLTSYGCKKLVETDGPQTGIGSSNLFNNDATAIGAVTSVYANLSSGSLTGGGELNSLSCIAGLSADELRLFPSAYNPVLSAFYQNNLNSSIDTEYWNTSYRRIFSVNSALEGLISSSMLTPGVKKQLIGEARFMRAFYYFYLTNIYGDVPLVLNTDYTTNALIRRSSKEMVYQQILADLKEAEVLLSDKYVKGDVVTFYPSNAEERVRPTKWAAIALMARTYLYLKDWRGAEEQANAVIANIGQYQIEPVDRVFLKNNREAIWQLQPVGQFNTMDARTFVIPSSGPDYFNPVYLSNDLVSTFDSDDQRRKQWINSVSINGIVYYYPYKYKIDQSSASVEEYSTVLRLSELYLIRGEARTHLGNLEGGVQDIDVIRKRAGLRLIKDVHPDINSEELLTAMLKERQLELFSEMGHRWLDLKRVGRVDEVMTTVVARKTSGSTWKSYQQLYPIALIEMKKNPNLIQNIGY